MRVAVCGAVLGLGIATCQPSPDRRLDSVVRDSAGIQLVELPNDGGEERAVTLVLDSTWDPAPGYEFGELLDIEVLADGRLALLDRLGARVLILSSAGVILAEFGRPGEGPGEFNTRGLSRLVATDSSVLVPDLFQQRISEFSLNGDLMGTRTFPGDGIYAVDWRAYADDSLAFRVLQQTGDQIVGAAEGTVDTIYSFPQLEDVPNLLLPTVPIWDIRGETLVIGTSGEWVVESRNIRSERPSWIARRAVAPPEFAEDDRAALERILMASLAREAGGAPPPPEEKARILAQVTFPSRRPVLAGLMLSPRGEVWVRSAVEVAAMDRQALRVGSAAGYGGTEWHVLTSAGLPHATVRLPDGFAASRLTDRWIFGIVSDEVGLQRPARIELPW